MVTFYTSAGKAMVKENEIFIYQKGKEYPLTKREQLLWRLLANDIIDGVNLKLEYESIKKSHGIFVEGAFEETLKSFLEKGIIIFGEGESFKEALLEVGEKLKEDMEHNDSE